MTGVKSLTSRQAEDEGSVMVTLEADGPMSASELADELALELGVVLSTLKDLENQGLIACDGDDPESDDWDIVDREEEPEFK